MIYRIFYPSSRIGLEVLPDQLRLVRLQKKKKSFLLEAAYHESLPSDVMTEGGSKRFESLQKILATMVERYQLKNTITALAVPEKMVRLQQISLSADLSRAEIEAEIQLQLRRDLPGLKEPLCVDFVILPTTHFEQIEVLFVAIRESYLKQLVASIEEAGLKVRRVDVDKLARQYASNFWPANLNLAPQLDPDLLLSKDWLVACGVAMQQIPLW